MSFFGLVDFFSKAVKFVRVWGKLLIVVGPAIAGFIWSPFFRLFFLGAAVGAVALFSLEYADVFSSPKSQYCINPKVDPNGPKCMKWVTTDEQRGYGYWKVCDGLQ